MEYTINQYGVIKVGDQVVEMQESSHLYKNYVKFLEEGGTVNDVVDEDVKTTKETFHSRSKTNRLITKESALHIHDQAIEDILDHLQVIQAKLDKLENEKQVISGISGHFTSVDGKTITIKNGIIKSITIKNK